MSVKPLTPQEATKKFQEQLPDFVIEAFNELLSENIGVDRRCTISQEDAVERILKKAAEAGIELSRSVIFDKKYLDIEDVYREAGWDVDFDKAAYYEEHSSFFTFIQPQD